MERSLFLTVNLELWQYALKLRDGDQALFQGCARGLYVFCDTACSCGCPDWTVQRLSLNQPADITGFVLYGARAFYLEGY